MIFLLKVGFETVAYESCNTKIKTIVDMNIYIALLLHVIHSAINCIALNIGVSIFFRFSMSVL